MNPYYQKIQERIGYESMEKLSPDVYKIYLEEDLIISLLGKYGKKTLNELVKLVYEIYPDKVNSYRVYRKGLFFKKTANRTEKQIYEKIYTMIGCALFSGVAGNYMTVEDRKHLMVSVNRDAGFKESGLIFSDHAKKRKKVFNREKVNGELIYDLNDIGMEVYKSLTTIHKSKKVEINTEEVIEKGINGINKGFVYLLQSKTATDFWKIGVTKRSIEYRVSQLSKDYRYGVWNLELKLYVMCDNCELVERELHNHFEDYRLNKQNNQNVNTELFKHSSEILQEFTDFIESLKTNPIYKIYELIEP